MSWLPPCLLPSCTCMTLCHIGKAEPIVSVLSRDQSDHQPVKLRELFILLAWPRVQNAVPEEDGHAGLRADIAVCMRVQSLAAAVNSSHAGAHKHERRLPVHGQIDSH